MVEPTPLVLGGQQLQSQLASHPEVGAIFICNDDLAQGGLLAALRLGISVPQLLVEHGFLFQPVYEPMDVGARRTARYPLTFAQAKEFVVAFKVQGLKKAG